MDKRNLLAAGIVAAVWASATFAGQATITDGAGYLNGTDGTGGAFTVTTVVPYNGEHGGPGGSVNSFSSFCIERNEYLSFGSTYFTDITTGAVNGGIAGGNPDPLDSATALLYRTFRDSGLINGTLIDDSAKVTSLQHAMWYIEQEMALGDLNAVALGFVTWAQSNAVAGNLYGVRVLNLYTGYNAQTGAFSGNSQDLLTIVPLPNAAWMGLGLLATAGGVSYLRRRSSLA